MGNVNNRFDVNVSSETKLKDKNILTFEFKLLADSNCRVKIEACQVYDCDGYMYQASGSNISTDDFILGKNSRFFTELKRVNVTISKNFKSRIGCNMVFTVIDVDDKKKMNLCFQKRSSTKWTFVGVSPLEYKESDIEPQEVDADNIQDTEVNNIKHDKVTENTYNTTIKDKTEVLHTISADLKNDTLKEEVPDKAAAQQKVQEQVKEEIKKEAKTEYVPSFARRYSTNYSAASVAGVIKRPQQKAVKPETEDVVDNTPVEQSDTNKENDYIKQNVIKEEDVKATAVVKEDVKEDIKEEHKKPSGVDAFRELLGAMADISAGKDIDLDLGRSNYDDYDEEDISEDEESNTIEEAKEADKDISSDKDKVSESVKPQTVYSYHADGTTDSERLSGQVVYSYSNDDNSKESTQTVIGEKDDIEHTENATDTMSDIPVYYRRKDSIDMLKQRIASDKNNSYLGMTLGAIMDKYDLDNQRLETFLNVFADRYKVADKSVNEQELRAKIEQDIINEYKDKVKEELTEQIKKELEEQEAEAAAASEEIPDTLEFYDIEPERVEAYLNGIIEYDADAAAQIGLSLSQTRVSVEEANGSYTATLYSEASYSKETYVLVRCPIVKVIFYDKKGNIANMAMHSVSRIYTGHDIIQMKLKTAQFKYWQNIGKLKIMITL